MTVMTKPTVSASSKWRARRHALPMILVSLLVALLGAPRRLETLFAGHSMPTGAHHSERLGSKHGRRRAAGVAASASKAAAASSAQSEDFKPFLDGPSMRVVVFGASGYIGRVVVDELTNRGHSVVAFTREKAGIGGAESPADLKARFGGAEVVVGDVESEESIAKVLSGMEKPVDAAVCCLASRSGGRNDSFAIDYQATVNCMRAAANAKASHFVLLSAVCVQRPKLAFQEAKLKAEDELQSLGEAMSYSIVRPTAFFKSLLGQVKAVKAGSPFVMFGDGTSVKCKPISESDLASFMADCLWDPAKKNKILPIGGPGEALSFKDQGEILFKLLDREPWFICVPYGVFSFVQSILDGIAGLSPDYQDLAEYGRIGRYYAEESMLVEDPKTGEYSGELTPSYGRTSLRDFLVEALEEGSSKLDEQKLGDQSAASRLGMS